MSVFKDRPGGGEDPGGRSEQQERGGKSWAQLLGSTLPSLMNKNILEVVLEKDQRGAFVVSEQDCARFMRRIGLDQHPGGDLDCVQICPNGRGVIFITLKETVKIEKFCRYDVIAVTESGIRATMVKPALKKEVVVTIRGLHPNTRDSTVLDYLAKFGKIVTTRVVHRTYTEGPLEGIKNGDRSYKMEVRAGVNIGSYHFLDGQKISLRYAGQQQTCGRCHEVPHKCKGNGVARRCEAEGGKRVEFADYILALWGRIGYSPSNVDSEAITENEEEKAENTVTSFTPVKVPTCDENKYSGVVIRQLPKDTDQALVVEFLCSMGLPEVKKDQISFKSNGVVNIDDIDSKTCKGLIEAIHGKENFGRKLYCNGLIPLTPLKPAELHTPSPPSTTSPPTPPPGTSNEGPISDPTSKSASFLAAVQAFEIRNSDQASNMAVVRRHSISLINRTPPKDSIAGEILEANSRPDFLKAQAALNDLKGLTDQLSDFGSCLSSFDSSEDSGEEKQGVESTANEGFKSMNDKKRNKRNKRKLKISPGKEIFLKKPNLTGTVDDKVAKN